MKRRDFLTLTGAGLAGTALGAGSLSVPAQGAALSSPADGQIKKALVLHMIDIEGSLTDKFALAKEAGFDGIQLTSPNEFATEEVLRARDETGLSIPSVIDSVHWNKTLSDPDPNVRRQGREGLKTALADAEAYGASTVLLVPAVVNKEVSYDAAYRRSQEEIRKVLPVAEERGVTIAIENVWNHFLLSPLEEARYIDELESEWVGAYFDVGNIVTYGWPAQWIRILGDRILELHLKGYSRDLRDENGPYAGFEARIGEGSVDWAAVREALQEIGYQGWATAEETGGGREHLAGIQRRMGEVLY